MSNTPQILLVVNPISANRDKSEIIKNVERAAKLLSRDVVLFETNGKTDKEDLQEIFEETTFERILALGGDGTIKLVAETLNNLEIPIGILPGGSANGLAVNLEIPQDATEAINIALGDDFVALDSIDFGGELCLHMSDLGLNAELIRNYETSSMRGKLGYLLQSIPTLISSNYPYTFKFEANGEQWKKEGVLLGFAVAQKYGTGANVNPNGKIDDGLFEVLIFKNLNLLEMLKTLRNEDELDPDFVESFSVEKVRINCDRKIPFQIDGEYRGEKQEIVAEISTKQFKIAVPASFKKQMK